MEDSSEATDRLPMLRAEGMDEVEYALGLGGTKDSEDKSCPAVGNSRKTWSEDIPSFL